MTESHPRPSIDFDIGLQVWHPRDSLDTLVSLPSATVRARHVAGAEWTDKTGTRRIQKQSYIHLQYTEHEESTLDKALQHYANRIRDTSLELGPLLETGGHASLYVTIYSNQLIGFQIPANILSGLGTHGVDLGLEFAPWTRERHERDTTSSFES